MPRQPILALGLFLALAPVFGPTAARAEAPPADEKVNAAMTPAGAVAPAEGRHGAAANPHGGEEAEPDILEPQPKLAIWTLVVFILLFLVLRKFAWKPISEALQRREEHLEHVLLEAERARNESERLLAEHRRQLEQATEQVRALFDEGRREAQAAADEIQKKAQAEAEATKQRAVRDIATARDQALNEIWNKAADLAVSVAGRVLAKELGPDEHRRLVDSAIGELPAAPASSNGHRGAHA
ncbi:MAG TPA: F0F1 ATP synthase subunit B [Isosphaeraceae bacterium]|nr:F0F1 ATP synthase subunit B [Isosphaeraceae bacterium]